MQKAVRITTIALLAALTALFLRWALLSTGLSLYNGAAAFVSVLLFGLCGARLLPRLFDVFVTDAAPAPDALPGPRANRRARRHPWLQIAACILISRAAILIIAYALYTAAEGYSGGLLDTLRAIWVRSDANSYLGIAENWYVTEGDPRFHIVFLPFYPIVIWLFKLITGEVFSAAMLTSSVCAAGAGIGLYELAALTLDRKSALRTVKFLFVLPAAFFLNAPMTESLFLLLTVWAMYFAQKHRLLPACILAGLSAFTRSAGVLLALPIAIEAASQLAAQARAGESIKKRTVLSALYLLIVPLGLIGYLIVNKTVTGDAFMFMEYQRDHWSQSFGLFFSTAAYQTDYLLARLAEGDLRQAYGLFLPNLLTGFAALGIMLGATNRLRPSYTAYFLAYYAFSMGATWLLSAPRYMTAAFPFAFALTYIPDGSRFRNVFATCVLCALQLAYLAMLVTGYPVY